MNSFSSGLYFSSREGFLAEAVVPVASNSAASKKIRVSLIIPVVYYCGDNKNARG